MRKTFKLQSAMEYLMTYGWAILIIAVVLGVLFQMGVFNSSSLTVRIPPGACKVLRTSAAVNLVGQCSGILPKYVAQFNGQSSNVNVPSSQVFSLSNQITISFWMYMSANPSTCSQSFNKGSSTSDANYVFYIGFPGASCIAGPYPDTVVYANVGGIWNPVSPQSSALSMYTWYDVVWSYNSVQGGSLYINGVSQGGPVRSGTLYADTDPLLINSGNFAGMMADVQIYNTTLDASQVQALYLEGIGGAPVNPQYLVGWWPLNGDTNDYSGNNNNGAPTAVTYVSQYGK